jgi:outer membrane protein OmpA-like peptidoglycan-associated protein
MKKKQVSLAMVVFLSSFTLSSISASAETAYAPAYETPWRENNWYLFGGLDLGVDQVGAFTPATEGSRSGMDGGVRLLLARYWPKWVLDGGMGYRLISSSGTNSDGSTTKVTSRIGFADLSPRYRFNHHWQLGPELQYWLTGDNGLNPNPNSTDKNNAVMIGLQGMYEWMDNNSKYRFGARWSTAANVENRSVNIFQAFFQFGFSVFDSDKSDEEYAPRRRNEQVNENDLEQGERYTAPADPLPIATPEPVAEATPWPTPEMPVVKPELKYLAANGRVGEELTVNPSVFKDNGVPVTSCTASPPLPAWATLDTTNCVVTGTPTEVMAPERFVITAVNEQGQSTSAPLVLGARAGKPKPQERLVLTLDVNDLPFAFDSARLPKYNNDRLREIGRFLGQHKTTWKQLRVEGHTDERGSTEYNDKLSTARARTVRQLLGEGGAPTARIKAIGYGERKPKAKGHNEKVWAQNRRVELVFIGVKDVVIMRDALKR